jgi:hypothetical protein
MVQDNKMEAWEHLNHSGAQTQDLGNHKMEKIIGTTLHPNRLVKAEDLNEKSNSLLTLAGSCFFNRIKFSQNHNKYPFHIIFG